MISWNSQPPNCDQDTWDCWGFMVWRWGPCRIQGCSLSTFICSLSCYWSPFDSKDWQQKHDHYIPLEGRINIWPSLFNSLVLSFWNRPWDCLVVGRTAPNHSWRNPVERTMSVIKLGLQCVGTNATQGQLRVRKECQQPECSARSHKVMKSAPSTPSVAFEQHNNLKQEPFLYSKVLVIMRCRLSGKLFT